MKAIQQGQYVRHSQYGLGVVTSSDADRTIIDFDLHGLKKFVTSLMAIEIIEGPAPERPREKRRKKTAAAPTSTASTGTK